MVALLGFKLKLGEIVLPLIFLGALMRLAGKGRVQAVGTGLAGFGLIFVGITAMQSGMTGLQGSVTPESFPPDTTMGRLLLLLIGLLITLITQSSSAGVAAALTAVHTGTVSLNQAAAMVIGMNLGTTATAAMATIGGNIQSRRTGFAHVVFNALTAVGAFLLLTPYFVLLKKIWPHLESSDPEIALISFHTFFNALGVIAILPFTRAFARLIVRLFPEQGNPLARRLDRGLLGSADVALTAVEATLQQLIQSLPVLLLPTFRDPNKPIDAEALAEFDDATLRTRDYLQELGVEPERSEQLERYARAVHILDHLQRISRRAHDANRLSRVRNDVGLSAMTDKLMMVLQRLAAAEIPIDEDTKSEIQHLNRELKAAMRSYRVGTLRLTAAGEMTTSTVLQRMDAARCLRRIGYHAWRIADHASSKPVDRSG